MRKKDDKVGNKTAYKKKCKEEKNRARKKNRNRFAKKKEGEVHIRLMRMPEKEKAA